MKPKGLRMLILTLAAYSQRDRVTAAFNAGGLRPLADIDDWLIGWIILEYVDADAPNGRRLYQMALRERELRREAAPALERVS